MAVASIFSNHLVAVVLTNYADILVRPAVLTILGGISILVEYHA